MAASSTSTGVVSPRRISSARPRPSCFSKSTSPLMRGAPPPAIAPTPIYPKIAADARRDGRGHSARPPGHRPTLARHDGAADPRRPGKLAEIAGAARGRHPLVLLLLCRAARIRKEVRDAHDDLRQPDAGRATRPSRSPRPPLSAPPPIAAAPVPGARRHRPISGAVSAGPDDSRPGERGRLHGLRARRRGELSPLEAGGGRRREGPREGKRAHALSSRALLRRVAGRGLRGLELPRRHEG